MRRAFAAAVSLALAGPAVAGERFDPFREVGIDARAGAVMPADAAFRDQAGRVFRLGEIFGVRPILLVPVYFNCPNICGTTLSQLAREIDTSGLKPGKDFDLIAFSFDARETEEDAARAAVRLPLSPVRLLTGPQTSIDAVTGALGFRYRWDDVLSQFAHASAVAVLGPDGRLARWLYGLSYQPEDLRLAVVEAGAGKIGTLGDRLLLLCYHYDPATGRYGGLVWSLLRAGGIATLAALVGFIAVMRIRDRRGLR